jgi:hypothetical protein
MNFFARICQYIETNFYLLAFYNQKKPAGKKSWLVLIALYFEEGFFGQLNWLPVFSFW